MKNPFTQLFSGSNVVTGPGNNDTKNIRTYKVRKAVAFLSLPEIQNIDAYNTKVKFLKSRSLNEDEVEEAFKQLNKSKTFRVDLHDIASDVIHDQNDTTTAIYRGQANPLLTIFSFCNKVLVFAGIATSCFYLYQQWLTMTAKFNRSKKEEANIQAELKQIKQELLRMATDLRQYQSVHDNQTKLLTEINSLKAILTSRQYFEEKKAAKLTMPSWQLNTVQTSSTSSPAVIEEPSNVNVHSSLTNGHVNGMETESKTSNITSAKVSILSEDEDPKPQPAITNGSSLDENKLECEVIKESISKSVQEKKESKKNKKHNSKVDSKN